MAVEIHLEDDELVLTVQGLHKIFAMKLGMTVPLAHVKGIRSDPESTKGWFQGVRVIGTGMGEFLRAGTYKDKEGLAFWDVHDHDKTVIIDLEHETYHKLVVEVEDPQKTIAEVSAALGRR